MLAGVKTFLRKVLPRPAYNLVSILRSPSDLAACASFIVNQRLNVSLRDRIRIVKQLYIINFNVESPHTQEEILNYIQAIVSLPRNGKGVVIEAGCFKGSSTAKFSLAADIAGKELVVFDSFQGMPDNDEPHDRNIFGGPARFNKGEYSGALDEVRNNVSRFGKVNRCRFVRGWFDDTLPGFREPVSAVYLDVDLASSTRTCLKYLYPLLESGGALYSQDGHLPLVIDVLEDDKFWVNEVGCKKPPVLGLHEKKLVKIIKQG